VSPDDLKRPLDNDAFMSIHMEEVSWITIQALKSLSSCPKCRK
jgi:hypothetical protein